jgi:hypothetical protein
MALRQAIPSELEGIPVVRQFSGTTKKYCQLRKNRVGQLLTGYP